MAAFNLTAIRPKGFLHTSAFDDVKSSLAWALSALGHETTLTENTFSQSATNIIFGAELLPPETALPSSSIIYNLEQSTHPNMENVRKLAKKVSSVWDFSLRNVERWKQGGDAKHVPIGYTPNLTRIPKAAVQDIDVCFLGWLTPRRLKIIDDLKRAGLKVFASDKCYGGYRDEILSRTKVCLNVHHDGRDLFEIVRVSFLLGNGKCVVSEISSDQKDYSYLAPCLIHNDYDGLALSCKTAVDNWQNCRSSQEEMTEYFRKEDYVSTVAAAMTEIEFDPKIYSVSIPISESEIKHAEIHTRYYRGCQEGDMVDFLPWIRKHAKGNILEIGTRDGASTSAFLLGVEANGGSVFSIDVDDCSQLWSHPQWKFHHGNSLSMQFPDATFDMALIDGDHSEFAFLGDLHNCYHWVKPGGLILVHDCVPERGHEFYAIPIRERLEQFVSENKLKWELLPGKYGMAVIQR